ncbi:nucleotide-diphospho-sugar transferase [Xylariomycetidae sp. FL2044]|nr:nucleotide-diphospho-sugar transferase [Xylariomycetidae sp. FL2044]
METTTDRKSVSSPKRPSGDWGFLFLFLFRYLRLLGNLIGYCLYRPTPIPKNPTIRPTDCTVIIPTVEPTHEAFSECCETVLANGPARLLIITVGPALKRTCEQVVAGFRTQFPDTVIEIDTTNVANKRAQVAHGLARLQTPFVALVDDHVFWPSKRFLPTALAPFEDPKVAVVGTVKRVRRNVAGWGMQALFNFLGAVYLERHNFDVRATNAIDGGVFVVSGRTSLWRSSVVGDKAFLDGFTHERFFFGRFGPLAADDDNFLTRHVVRAGHDVRWQDAEHALIETTLGEFPRYLSQCLRWARTTWRSNSASLFTDRTPWRRYPWTTYAALLASFTNFALFYDAALMYALYYHTSFGRNATAMVAMASFIFVTKILKLLPHFWRHPRDVAFFPGYVIFAYYHSLLKLYALFTFYVIAWSGRNLDDVNEAGKSPSSTPEENVSK